MSSFIMTPTNIDLINSLVKDPITGRWIIPILTFNTRYINPYYGEVDPLNEDYRYQEKVIDHFYVRLSEKWLFREPIFRKLLKYFKVERSGDKGTVSLIQNPEKTSDNEINEDDRKFVFKYIDKYFVTERFVEKTLREYITTTHIKWYDLFNNTDNLKELFCHKLKKLIIETIYQLHDTK